MRTTSSAKKEDEGESCNTRSRISPSVSRRRLGNAKEDGNLWQGRRRGRVITLRTNCAKEEDGPDHFGDKEHKPWPKLPLGKYRTLFECPV